MAESKNVMTVSGAVMGSELGVTLPHEHMHMTFDVAASDPPTHVPSWPTSMPAGGKELFSLRTLGLVRQYPYSVPYNRALNDEDAMRVMVEEMRAFKELGGSTIVENTTHGLQRNLPFLRELSEASGVKIIAGTGYYIASAQTDSTLALSVEEMHDVMRTELENGDNEGIRCGVVGEIGSSWPIHPFERRAIEAVAAVQEATGKPVTFHPGRSPEAPFEIVRLFAEAGGKPGLAVMSHLDRTLQDKASLLEFASLGTFTQFDLFGTECSWYQIEETIDMPSDAQRVERIGWLKEAGYLRRILLSHDIHTKHRLVSYGGHGYGHVLQNVVPKMRVRGWSQTELDTVLIHNPRIWLCGD